MVRELDEDDVRVRPGRSSRPRTRIRPGHEDAAAGRVVTVDRGRYRVRTDDDVLITCVRARELGRRAVVTGDRVALVGELGGGPDALGRIVRVETRTSLLRRTPDDSDPVERAVVANAQVLVVVTALADPVPRPRLIDRCLVAAYDGGLVPLLCLTKNDLAPADELLALYQPLGVEALVTGPGSGVDALRERLQGKVSVLFGQSGVGKGRHVSSSAIALELPGGGTVIDTPGVRSFGLGAVTPDGVLAAFPDLAEGALGCPPSCAHLTPESGCALDAWVATGAASADRLFSLRRLLQAKDGDDPAGG